MTSTSLIPSPPTRRFSSFALLTPEARTGLALLNPFEAAATVTLELVDGEGSTRAVRDLELPAKSKVVGFLDEVPFFPGFEELEGSVWVRGDQPVAATVIRVDGTFWSTFPVFDQDGNPERRASSPVGLPVEPISGPLEPGQTPESPDFAGVDAGAGRVVRVSGRTRAELGSAERGTGPAVESKPTESVPP